MTPWPFPEIAETPVARLAFELSNDYSFELPPQIAVEELGAELAERFELVPPVSFEDALRILRELEIVVNPPGLRPLDKGHHGNNDGQVESGFWVVTTNEHDALTRQTLTLFHELYEILRKYLHEFGCARFPPGMRSEDYVPERYARRFSAAITLPRQYVHRFLLDHGLNIPRLISESGRSAACISRRLMELMREGDILGRDVPFLAIRCALMPSLLHSSNPRTRCVEHVRSPKFSVRRDRLGGRDYLLPRTREEWKLGTLVRAVMESAQPVFVHRVTGFDLFGERDLSALAVPEMISERVGAVTIYATLAADAAMWDLALEEMECIQLGEVQGLLSEPAYIPKRRSPTGELVDTRIAIVREEPIEVSIFRRRSGGAGSEDEELEEDEHDLRRILRLTGMSVRLYLSDDGQVVWDWEADQDDEWGREAA